MPLEPLSIELETVERMIKEKESELGEALKKGLPFEARKLSEELYELNLKRANVWSRIKREMTPRRRAISTQWRAFGGMVGIFVLVFLALMA